MAIGSTEQLVFRNKRAALWEVLKRDYLLFQTQDKGSSSFRLVVGDILPYFGDILLSG